MLRDGDALTGIGTIMLGIGALSGSALSLLTWRRSNDHGRQLEAVAKNAEVRKSVDAVIERELTPNGGQSMKDHTTFAVNQIRQVNAQLGVLRSGLADARKEIAADRHATGVVLDLLNEQADAEHVAIWRALGEHGINRRSPDPKKENP